MSEYLHEALWREQYRDLVSGLRLIREAIKESCGSCALSPNAERAGSTIEDCEYIALAITVAAEKTKRAIAELEEQISLTNRVNIEGVTEHGLPSNCD